jgi:hypothetical protein
MGDGVEYECNENMKGYVRYVSCYGHGHVANVIVAALLSPIASFDFESLWVAAGDGLILAVTTSDGEGDVLLKPTICFPIARGIGDPAFPLGYDEMVYCGSILQAQSDLRLGAER